MEQHSEYLLRGGRYASSRSRRRTFLFKYKCLKCGKGFNACSIYKERVKSPEGLKHQCMYCSKLFTSSRGYRKHQALHSIGLDVTGVEGDLTVKIITWSTLNLIRSTCLCYWTVYKYVKFRTCSCCSSHFVPVFENKKLYCRLNVPKKLFLSTTFRKCFIVLNIAWDKLWKIKLSDFNSWTFIAFFTTNKNVLLKTKVCS